MTAVRNSGPGKPGTGKSGPGKSGPGKANRRGASRLAVVQALYQMDVSGSDLISTVAEFEQHRLGSEIEGDKLIDADVGYFRDLVAGVVKMQRRIDTEIDETLQKGWPLRRLDLTLRAILRAGAYELMERRDVPARVVISEYVDIARAFFEEGDEPGLVNALLDRMARHNRQAEFG